MSLNKLKKSVYAFYRIAGTSKMVAVASRSGLPRAGFLASGGPEICECNQQIRFSLAVLGLWDYFNACKWSEPKNPDMDMVLTHLMYPLMRS